DAAKQIKAVLATYRGKLKSKDVEDVGDELLAAAAKDKDKARASMTRQLVVSGQAALDEVEKVAQALADPKPADMRTTAVLSVRHWIGAAPGRDQILYDALRGDLEYSQASAETVMQLLHSPFDPDQPETYEALIAYLKHGRMAVRELAAWHLYRLAPAG